MADEPQELNESAQPTAEQRELPDHTWAGEGFRASDILSVCQDCGKILRFPQAPHLENRYSEEPEVQQEMDRLRGMPHPTGALKDATRRPGGKVHMHTTFLTPSGERRTDPISGSQCEDCTAASMAERNITDERRALFRKVFEDFHSRTGSESGFNPEKEALNLPPDQAALFLGKKPKRTRKPKKGA